MGESLGKVLWTIGHQASACNYHIPAIVRGLSFIVCRFVASQLSISLPAVSLGHLSFVAPQRATQLENSLIGYLTLTSSNTFGSESVFSLDNLRGDVEKQLLSHVSSLPHLPCLVSDAIEEVFLIPNLDSVSSRDFATTFKRLLASDHPFVPRRFVDRLIRVELAPFEDSIRHLPFLMADLLERFMTTDGDGHSPDLQQSRLLPVVQLFVSDLLNVLPSVSPRDFVSFCELATRVPHCFSAVVSGNFPESNILTQQFLKWLLTESTYYLELKDVGSSGERRIPLLFWPSGLVHLLTVDSSFSPQLAKRGWSPHQQDVTEIAFRREAFEHLGSILAEMEVCSDALQDFVTDSVELNHFTDEFIDQALTLPNSSRDDEPKERESCDDFVQAFLGHDSSVGKLYTQVQDSRVTLGDVENILVTFLDRIAAVRNEIGNLREQSSRRATMLENSSAVEKIVSEVVTHLVVPPDVVHIVSNAESCIELGPQFRHALKILHGILQDRCGGHQSTDSLGSSLSGRAVKVVLPETLAFRELIGVPEDLAVLACSRIKVAFDEKLSVLKRPRTNIAVQQEHIVGPLHPFIRFVRVVIPLLRRSASFWKHNSDANPANIHPPPPAPNFHYTVVRKLYAEMRLSYVDVMRVTYFQNISRYLMQLKKLEEGSSSSQGWSLFSARQTAFTLPPLTDIGAKLSPGDFGMGRRQKILETLLTHPVVPIIATSKGQQLMYEETFRSVNVILCDVVTREFLFTFDFFGGDDTIYAEVFRPVVQYIIDYVAEMLLQVSALFETEVARRDRTLSHSHFGNMKFSCSNTDVVGLLTLIRMCHVFRMHMRCIRRLDCLNGFYDSLLELLWPAFKRALGIQIDSMRSLSAGGMMKFLSQLRAPVERLAAVHPITLRYAEFTAAIISLAIPMKVDATTARSSGLPPVAEDGADSTDHLVALRANLSILRIEFMRVIGTVVSELAREGPPLMKALSAATMVNNLYHVVTIWSLTPPLVIAFESDNVLSERIVSSDSVDSSADFVALSAQLNAARSQFVEQLLRLVFPWLIAVTRGTCSTVDAVSGAKNFYDAWQESFATAYRHIQTVLAHPKNQQETLPQFCMQLLLYNTRSHSHLAQLVDSALLKTMLVTNQQIIKFVGTFAHLEISSPVDSLEM